MNGTPKQVNIDLLMAALSGLITGETDGDERKQERLRRTRRLRVEIETPSIVGLGPDEEIVQLAVRCWDDYESFVGFIVTDDREKWRTWANELGLRMP